MNNETEAMNPKQKSEARLAFERLRRLHNRDQLPVARDLVFAALLHEKVCTRRSLDLLTAIVRRHRFLLFTYKEPDNAGKPS